MIRFLLTLILVFAATAAHGQTVEEERRQYWANVFAQAEEWGQYRAGPDNPWLLFDGVLEPDNIAYFTYLNTKRITRLANQRLDVWLKKVYKQDYTPHGSYQGHRSSMTHLQVDCVGQRLRFGAVVYYDQNGRVVNDLDHDGSWGTWSDTMPETQGELWVREICGYARRNR